MTREGVYKLNDEKREIFGKTWGIFQGLRSFKYPSSQNKTYSLDAYLKIFN